jgi:hypothetical protein
MASSSAKTVDEYLASLPPDRRAALSTVRDVVNARLPPGYQEVMFGMIGWCVPLSRYPNTYNKQPLALAGLAAQKQYNALYLMTVYSDLPTDKWFRAAFAAAGKKLDMGKSCVRFKTADDLPLDLIGEVIAKFGVDDYIARVEAVMGSARKTRAAGAKKPAAKAKAKAKKAAPAKKKAAPARKAPAKSARGRSGRRRG